MTTRKEVPADLDPQAGKGLQAEKSIVFFKTFQHIDFVHNSNNGVSKSTDSKHKQFQMMKKILYSALFNL